MKLQSLVFGLMFTCKLSHALPLNFVYLHDIDATILQDMRYAQNHNFIGHPIRGYVDNTCILTKQAAHALASVQKELLKISLSLKVYDCYRPTMAVAEFMEWSKDLSHQEMKREFYPNIDKANVFKLGYVAEKSGHSRGSTVDLTIVSLPTRIQTKYHPNQCLAACTASYAKRFQDNSIDMGTGYDCLDEKASVFNRSISQSAYNNRMLLRNIMIKKGFQPYDKEWWHFTLNSEPYPHMYFNFIVKN